MDSNLISLSNEELLNVNGGGWRQKIVRFSAKDAIVIYGMYQLVEGAIDDVSSFCKGFKNGFKNGPRP